MKLLSLLSLSLIVSLLPLQANANEPRGDARITKNEAQHIALQHHRGARVSSARLAKVNGKSVWLIELTGPKANRVSEVSVDAMSGRVVSDKKSNR